MKKLFWLIVMLLLVTSLYAVPKTLHLAFYPYENTKEEVLKLESVIEKGMGLEAKSYIDNNNQYWVHIEFSKFDFDDSLHLFNFKQLDEVTSIIMGVGSEYYQGDYHLLSYHLKMNSEELADRFSKINL